MRKGIAMARKRTKGKNGVGTNVNFKLDANDAQEVKALRMAQVLATKHGRRKDVIVELLSVMYDRYSDTGEIMTPSQISAALMGMSTRTMQPLGFQPQQIVEDGVARKRSFRDDAPLVTVTKAKVSAAQVAANMTASFGAMGFFD